MSFYHIIENMISGEDRARRYRSKEKNPGSQAVKGNALW
jgi:hypothetical protein